MSVFSVADWGVSVVPTDAIADALKCYDCSMDRVRENKIWERPNIGDIVHLKNNREVHLYIAALQQRALIAEAFPFDFDTDYSVVALKPTEAESLLTLRKSPKPVHVAGRTHIHDEPVFKPTPPAHFFEVVKRKG